MPKASIAPDGKEYLLPTPEENEKERLILEQITAEQRAMGRKIVAVQGLGFVGCVYGDVVADSVDASGNPVFYVHGHQRDLRPFLLESSGDQYRSAAGKFLRSEVPDIFKRCVLKRRNFRATSEDHVYTLVDVVVVDIQLDATSPHLASRKGCLRSYRFP
jgi:hypothetical protein